MHYLTRASALAGRMTSHLRPTLRVVVAASVAAVAASALVAQGALGTSVVLGRVTFLDGPVGNLLVTAPPTRVEGVATGNQVVATFTHPGTTTVGDLTATINWGDGSPATPGTIGYDAGLGRFTVTGNHTFIDESTSYASAVQVNGLTAYYRLDQAQNAESTPDTSPFGNTATAVGSVLGQQPGATADGDGSTTFDGSTGYFEVPYHGLVNNSVFSVEAWVYPTGGAGTFRSVATSRSCSGGFNGWVLYGSDADTWQFWVGAGGQWHPLDGGSMQYNAWSHLVATYDGTTSHIYVNGQLTGQMTTSMETNDCSPLRIGAGATESSPNFFFVGGIDEFAYYATVLSPDAINRHFLKAGQTGNLTITVSDSDDATSVSASVAATVVDGAIHLSPGGYTAAPAGQDGGLQTLGTIIDNTAGVLSDLQVAIDWGDGTSADPGTLVPVPGGVAIRGGHRYSREGAYAIRTVVTDVGGSTAKMAFGTGVADGILTLNRPDPMVATLGQFTPDLAATFSDSDSSAGSADYRAIIDWGDGVRDRVCNDLFLTCPRSEEFVSSDTVHGSHRYARVGSYTYTVTLIDSGGASTSVRGSVRVTPPVLNLRTGYTRVTFRPGTPFTFPGQVVTFTDDDGNVSIASAYSVLVVWGDGAQSAGSVAYSDGLWRVTAPTHTYAYAGVYGISIIVRDIDKSVASVQILASDTRIVA